MKLVPPCWKLAAASISSAGNFWINLLMWPRLHLWRHGRCSFFCNVWYGCDRKFKFPPAQRRAVPEVLSGPVRWKERKWPRLERGTPDDLMCWKQDWLSFPGVHFCHRVMVLFAKWILWPERLVPVHNVLLVSPSIGPLRLAVAPQGLMWEIAIWPPCHAESFEESWALFIGLRSPQRLDNLSYRVEKWVLRRYCSCFFLEQLQTVSWMPPWNTPRQFISA